jgi:hypothetical protein
MLRRLLLISTALAFVAVGYLGMYVWLQAHEGGPGAENTSKRNAPGEKRSPYSEDESVTQKGDAPNAEIGEPKAGSKISDQGIVRKHFAKEAKRDSEAIPSDRVRNEELEVLKSQIDVLRSQMAEKDAESQQMLRNQQDQQAAAQSLQTQLQSQQTSVSELLRQRAESARSDSEPERPDHVKQIESANLPVYNAIFTPTTPGQPSSLIDGKKTLLRFFIGPNSLNNALGKDLAEVARRLAETTSDVPLTITMECGFCTGRRTDLIKVVYHGRTQLSSEAQFHIVPSLAIAQSLGSSVIVVDIRNSDTAVRYNRLALNMKVQGAGSVQSSGDVAGLGVGAFTPRVVDTRSFRPDVIVTLRPEYGKPFDVGFEAINPELRERLSGLDLGKKQLDGVRQVQFFHTYDLTSSELSSDQGETLTTLKGLMDQQNADLQQALAATPSGAVLLDTRDFVKLSQSDREKAFATFAQLGDYLYTRLFLNSGGNLKKLIGTLEAFIPTDKHPLRILIKTSGQAFPWQLLHVAGAQDDTGFWGFKFEIAVEDMSRPSPAVVLKQLGTDNSGVSLFGTYVGADYSVQSLGNQQAKYFSQVFPSRQVIPANSSLIFRDSLKKRSSDLDFVLVYTHGSDGWMLIQQANGQYTRSQLVPPGQRLIFNQDGSFVGPTDITALANGFDTSNGPFLRRNPVVLLNACETGMLFTEEFTLPIAFLHLGARAVIATEAPVSNKFALLFGDALIDQMAQGKDMAAGVLDVRKKFLEQGNPLGLVYAYYMNDGIAGVAEAK